MNAIPVEVERTLAVCGKHVVVPLGKSATKGCIRPIGALTLGVAKGESIGWGVAQPDVIIVIRTVPHGHALESVPGTNGPETDSPLVSGQECEGFAYLNCIIPIQFNRKVLVPGCFT